MFFDEQFNPDKYFSSHPDVKKASGPELKVDFSSLVAKDVDEAKKFGGDFMMDMGATSDPETTKQYVEALGTVFAGEKGVQDAITKFLKAEPGVKPDLKNIKDAISSSLKAKKPN